MKVQSPKWDETIGICTKHMLPSVPCPACLADGGDEDLECVVTDIDLVLDAEQAAGHALTLLDLVPNTVEQPRFIRGYN